jgi:3-dehydroquinate dehydratase/shikimate dehydrogenase
MAAPARVCLRLEAGTVEACLGALARHRGEVDMAALRADLLDPGELAALDGFPARAGLPVVLAARRRRDGGRWTGGEPERLSLLRRLAAAGFAFVELEEDVPLRLPGVRVLRTLHDAGGVPSDLERRLRALARGPGEVPQAVVAVRGSADLARLAGAAVGTLAMEKVLVGTGDAGLATRVLAARLGSAICPVSPAGPSNGPGDPDPLTLRDRYRFASLDRDTPVFGVIGFPVMHSLSPVIHNRAMAALGIPGVYLPFPVDDLPAFMGAADLLGVTGLSVTVPHKEAILPFLGTREPIVDLIGACNTLARADARAPWHGTNTDAEGFLAPLVREWGGRSRTGLRAAVIGAGGASRAVVAALAAEGADVLVLNRTPERARELAARFGARWAGLDAAGLAALAGHAELIVQATSAGMGEGSGDPVPGYRFTGRETAYELVYAPRETPFLARARAAGCTVIPGIRMLLAQARGQFALFTGQTLPTFMMEDLERELRAAI